MHIINKYKGKYRIRTIKIGFWMTESDILSFLQSMKANGKTDGTIEEYKGSLRTLYRFLPGDKQIGPDTLRQWRESMLEQYSIRTINTRISAANSFLLYCGRRDLTLSKQLKTEQELRPELTRREYLCMLQTAKQLNKERLYLLVKLFACTGIAVKDICLVTVDGVRSGSIRVGGKEGVIHIPDCLQKELLDYAMRNELNHAIFVTRGGKPLRRTSISDMIRALCPYAQVDEEKGSPRCLRKLYMQTRKSIRQNIELLVEHEYARVLDREQLVAGWE